MKRAEGNDREEARVELEVRLGHAFTRPELLKQALRHSSAAHESGLPSNERLEFLGDAALSHAAAEMVFGAWPEAGEGELTRGRALLVQEATLSGLAEKLGLARVLETATGVVLGPALLADALEAVLGAVLLDGGWERFQTVTGSLFGPVLAGLEERNLSRYEPKSTLQELAQQRRMPLPVYRQVASRGPGHRQVFVVEVELDGRVLGRGEGNSKRTAQQAAAREALDRLRQEGELEGLGG